MNYWFSTEIDRCFRTGCYGGGVRFHSNPLNVYDYQIITGVSYDEEKNILVVKNSSGEQITIKREPYTPNFVKTIRSQWEEWDKSCGKYEEDRTDYEPWCHKNMKSLAKTLGLYEGEIDKKDMYV